MTGGIDTVAANGDLVVAICGWGHQGSTSTPTMSTTGYTAQVTDEDGAFWSTGLQIATKFMGATPDTSAVVNGSNISGGGVAIIAAVFRGVDSSIPVDVTPVLNKGTAAAYPSVASITTATDNAVILNVWTAGYPNQNYTWDTSSPAYDIGESEAGEGATYDTLLLCGVDSGPASAGLYTPITPSFGGTDGNFGVMDCSIALMPG